MSRRSVSSVRIGVWTSEHCCCQRRYCGTCHRLPRRPGRTPTRSRFSHHAAGAYHYRDFITSVGGNSFDVSGGGGVSLSPTLAIEGELVYGGTVSTPAVYVLYRASSRHPVERVGALSAGGDAARVASGLAAATPGRGHPKSRCRARGPRSGGRARR